MSKQKPNSNLKSADMQGEGNYKAAKEYDDATTNYVKAGKVGAAVREAKPKNIEEEREMLEAEVKGRARAKTGKQVHIPEPNTGTDNANQNGSKTKHR